MHCGVDKPRRPRRPSLCRQSGGSDRGVPVSGSECGLEGMLEPRVSYVSFVRCMYVCVCVALFGNNYIPFYTLILFDRAEMSPLSRPEMRKTRFCEALGAVQRSFGLMSVRQYCRRWWIDQIDEAGGWKVPLPSQCVSKRFWSGFSRGTSFVLVGLLFFGLEAPTSTEVRIRFSLISSPVVAVECVFFKI